MGVFAGKLVIECDECGNTLTLDGVNGDEVYEILNFPETFAIGVDVLFLEEHYPEWKYTSGDWGPRCYCPDCAESIDVESDEYEDDYDIF